MIESVIYMRIYTCWNYSKHWTMFNVPQKK